MRTRDRGINAPMQHVEQRSPVAPISDRVPLFLGRVLPALVLVGLAYAVGARDLDAPWLQGDEQIFLAQNPDVAPPDGDGRSLPQRLGGIFTHIHEDLYQPLPIWTYAVEWQLWGEQRIAFMRQTDVLIHAANALLLWSVLARLIPLLSGVAGTPWTHALAWALALLWAAHPALATAYAADMGRTHLLSALFALASLRVHIESMSDQRRPLFLLSLVLLALAMMSKVLSTWMLVVLSVECAVLGFRAALASPRVYLVAAICAAFTIVNYAATRASGILEDAGLALFGDPGSRSLLALWIYLRHAFAPLGLSIWYPPDPLTSWSYAPTWLGLAGLIALLTIAALAARRRPLRGIAVGIVCFLALLAPVIGLVGARVSAAQDRYLYLPLAGLLLAIGSAIASTASTAPRGGWARRAAVIAIAALALLVAPIAESLSADARSMIRRAERSRLGREDDPRLLEYLAVANAFAIAHDTLEGRAVDRPDFATRALDALDQAAVAAEEHPRYFRDAADRAAFHRRLSFQMLSAARPEDSLEQALRAAEFQPDAPFTLTRLAHAYRALERWDDALRVYQQLESSPPPDPTFRALRLTELGDLLLYVFDRADLARARYQAALETRAAPPRAGVGLARCEVLVGEGSEGFAIASEVLRYDPENVEAALVIALYHLRSHHWEQAEGAYRAVLGRDPVSYEALIGLNELYAQRDAWRDAALVWQQASDLAPDRIEFQAFFAWAAAWASDPAAAPAAERVLKSAPGCRFALLAQAVDALRAGRSDEAVQRARDAVAGTPIARGRELERTVIVLKRFVDAARLPPAGEVVRAILVRELSGDDAARAILVPLLETSTEASVKSLAESILRELSAPNGDSDENPP